MEIEIIKNNWYYILREKDSLSYMIEPLPKRLKIITLIITKKLPIETREKILDKLTLGYIRDEYLYQKIMIEFEKEEIEFYCKKMYEPDKYYESKYYEPKVMMNIVDEENIIEEFLKKVEKHKKPSYPYLPKNSTNESFEDIHKRLENLEYNIQIGNALLDKKKT